MTKIFIAFLFVLSLGAIVLMFTQNTNTAAKAFAEQKLPMLATLPQEKILANGQFVAQSYNNCGPASLSMALSYFGIKKSQEELGYALRPYQNPEGENDDKSVSLEELAQKSQELDLLAYYRPNGDINLIKAFIANNIPVITKTLENKDVDIGHYRVVKGYDDDTQTLIQDDPIVGDNLEISYDEFDLLWKRFNYEYLVIVTKDKRDLAKAIIGENFDKETAWRNAQLANEAMLNEDPSDIYAQFNNAIASYHLGEYEQTVESFEKVQSELPFRTLWYQPEPITAYYHLGQYDKVFSLTDEILQNENPAFSELYLLRGKIYQKQGKTILAKKEFEQAVYYNKNLKKAQNALMALQLRMSIIPELLQLHEYPQQPCCQEDHCTYSKFNCKLLFSMKKS